MALSFLALSVHVRAPVLVTLGREEKSLRITAASNRAAPAAAGLPDTSATSDVCTVSQASKQTSLLSGDSELEGGCRRKLNGHRPILREGAVED